MQKTIKIGPYKISNNLPLAFMAGTCVIESEKHYIDTAKKLKTILAKTKHPFILKASFDKANRTSVDAYRGPGLAKGLDILAKAKAVAHLANSADWKLNGPTLIQECEPLISGAKNGVTNNNNKRKA